MADLNKLNIDLKFVKTIENGIGQRVDMYLLSESPMVSIGVPHGSDLANRIAQGLRSVQDFNLRPSWFGIDWAKRDK